MPSIEEAGREQPRRVREADAGASVCGSFGLDEVTCGVKVMFRRYRRAAESYGGTTLPRSSLRQVQFRSVFNRRAVPIRDHLHQRAFGIGFVPVPV